MHLGTFEPEKDVGWRGLQVNLKARTLELPLPPPVRFGMFLLILTVLNGDDNRGY